MTISKELQPWYRADVTFKLISDPTQNKVVKFVNRTAIGGTATYWPLLGEISGVGQQVNQDGMPDSPGGSVIINDTPESFGSQRRVVDLLERYTLTEQAIVLYWAQSTLGDNTVPSSWNQYWAGKVSTPEWSDGQLTLSVETTPVAVKPLHKIIDETLAPDGFAVPESSLGKALPVPIGACILPAYSVKEASADNARAIYSFAAIFGTQYTTSPQVAYYKTRLDTYKAIDPIFGAIYSFHGTSPIGLPTSHGKTELIISNWYTPYSGSTEAGTDLTAATGVKWTCKGQNNGGITPTGSIVFTAYARPKGSDTGWISLTSVTIAKSAYLTQVRLNSNFDVQAVFPEPIIVGETEELGIGIVLTEYDTSTTDFTSASSLSSDNYQTRITDGGQFVTVNSYAPMVAVQSIVGTFVNDNMIDTNGFCHQYLVLEQAAGSVQCDMTKLDILVDTSGICDNVAGTITGVPSVQLPITRPDYVLKLITQNWNGSTWSFSTDYDFTSYSSQYSSFSSGSYQRQANGFLEGTITVEDFVTKLVEEMACFLVPQTNGKLALLPWGARLPVSKVFTDENCKVKSFRWLDSSSVVNSVSLGYAKNYLNIDSKWIIEGDAANRTAVMTVNADSTLFGVKIAESRTASLIADDTTAATYCNFVTKRHDMPGFVAQIEVPFYENYQIENMKIVDLQSVDLPAHFGTNFHAHKPTFAGTTTDIFKGRNAIRGNRYRMQIIGAHVDHSNEDAPKIIFDLNSIKPTHPNDPTTDAAFLIGT